MKLTKTPKLLKERRGVSAVISNIILVAAVIVVGFSALAWTYSQSNIYVTQYGETVNSDINKLKERISFEYVFYNDTAPKSLSVYVMNSGKINNVNITTVYISNTSWVSPPTSVQPKFLNKTSAPDLDIGEEGYFLLSIALQTRGVYTVKVITWRGSSFANTFVA